MNVVWKYMEVISLIDGVTQLKTDIFAGHGDMFHLH